MRSELTQQELRRMSVAQLAEYGRQALQAGLYDRAAALFREAVRRAPMRQDFKDCLSMAIEGSLFENPHTRPQPRPAPEPRPARDPRDRDPRDLPERRDAPGQRPPQPERRPLRPAEPQPEAYPEPRRPEPPPQPELRFEPRFEDRSEPARPVSWTDPLDALPAEEDDASDLAGPAAPYSPPPRPAPRPEERRAPRPEYVDPEPRPAPRPRPPREAERPAAGREALRPRDPHPPRGAEPYPPRPQVRPRPELPRRPAAPQGPAAHYRPGDFNRRHQRGPISAYLFGAFVGFLMCGAIAAGGWFYLQSNPKVLAGLRKDSSGADLQLAMARARAFTSKGEYSRAIDVLMEQADSPDRNKVLAGMFNDQGDNQITHQSPPRFEAAIEAFKSAIKYDPNNLHYRGNLADAYYQFAVSQEATDHKVALNFLDLAQQSCENVLDQDSKNLEALTILKRVALKKRDDALLAKTYKRIIEAAPGSPEAAEARKNLDELKLR